MAELSVTVGVRLEPDKETAAWLVSLGWTPPQEEGDESEEPCVCPEPRVALTGAEACREAEAAEAKRMRSQSLYYSVTRKAGFEALDSLLESLGVDLFWLKRPGADSVI